MTYQKFVQYVLNGPEASYIGCGFQYTSSVLPDKHQDDILSYRNSKVNKLVVSAQYNMHMLIFSSFLFFSYLILSSV